MSALERETAVTGGERRRRLAEAVAFLLARTLVRAGARESEGGNRNQGAGNRQTASSRGAAE